MGCSHESGQRAINMGMSCEQKESGPPAGDPLLFACGQQSAGLNRSRAEDDVQSVREIEV